MKRTVRFCLLITFMLGLSISLIAQNFEWAKQMGGISDDAGATIAVDAFGNVYTTGYFQNTVDFNPGSGVYNLTSAGSIDIFISKLDAFGNFIWAKSMGGTGMDVGHSITTDAAGNVYTTGRFNGIADFDPGSGVYNLTSSGLDDIFISKLDASGNFVWANSIGGTGQDRGFSISTDTAGNIYTTGSFQGTVDFDPGSGVYNLTSVGSSSIFISKYDVNGNFLWAKAFTGSGNGYGRSITINQEGNVYATGGFQGTVDFDPGAGTFNLTSAGGTDIFICKIDADGNFIWARAMGNTGSDVGQSITTDSASNVLTTGFFSGTVDFNPGLGIHNLTAVGTSSIFISKLDVNGDFIWAKAMGGTGMDVGHSITTDAAGNVYTTGGFSGTVDFDPGPDIFNLTAVGNSSIFISKLDKNGDFGLAIAIGGIGLDIGNSITIDDVGNVFTTGSFQQTADFDPGSGIYNLTSAGGRDIYVHKMSQCTAPVLSTSTTSPTCPGGTGTAIVSVTSSTGPYTYSWSNSQTGPSITGVPAGTYSVTVTDSSSCAAITSVTITEPPAILSGAVVSHPPCYGSTGAISLSPANGTAPYTFYWSTAAATAALSGLVPGMYTVTITDNEGCTAVDSFEVNAAPSILNISTSVTTPQCYDGNGAIVANVLGGTAPYVYLWSTGASSSTLNGIPAGTYSLTVTDNNSCSDTISVTITQPPAMAAVLSATASHPTPNCDGTATASASGGVPPYSYAWSNGATGESINGLCAGIYGLTITDSGGCAKVDSVSVLLTTSITNQSTPGSINVYPNPSAGHFVIETGGMNIRTISVYNTLGKRVLTMEPGNDQSPDQVVSINLSSRKAGIYLLVVELEGHIWHTERLILGQ